MSSAPTWLPRWIQLAVWGALLSTLGVMAAGTLLSRAVPDVSDLVVAAPPSTTAPAPSASDYAASPENAYAAQWDELEAVAVAARTPPPDADTPHCPDDPARWRCYRDARVESAERRVSAMIVGRSGQWLSSILAWLTAPDLSLHPSAAVVLRVTDLAGWVDAHDGDACERNVALYINQRRLADLRPTACDLQSGRVLFQLRNLNLQLEELHAPGHGWKALLATRSHTFWTDASFTVGWAEEPPLPTDVGWRAGAVLWLLPPVNAWMALAAIGFAGGLVLVLGLYTGMLREGDATSAWSLSRVQGAWWFLCTFASWEILCAFQRDMVAIPPKSLALLGIAGGTYSVSIARDVVANAKGPTRGFWKDLVSDRDGPVMHRLQMAAWSLALGVAYVYGTVVQLDMPDLDETLLVLMGMSSAGYLSMKHTEKPLQSVEAAPPPAPPA
jgi:hypothetical protein